MNLKSRQMRVLRFLSRGADGVPLDELASELGISRRTLYYDINNLNDYLRDSELGSLVIENQVLRSQDVCWEALAKLTEGSSQCNMQAQERQSMIFLYVALSDIRTTIGSLMENFEVSRNTIIADIRELKTDLSKAGLRLDSAQRTGYCVEGDELSVRKFIWKELQRLSDAEHVFQVKKFLQATLVRVVANDLDYFELCRSLIKQYETDLKTRCFLENNGLEGMMIQVSWLRGLSGNLVEMSREEQVTLMGTVSYRSIRCSVEKLKSIGVLLPSSEILYITSLLLGIKTTTFPQQREEDAYVSGLAARMISNFERVGCLTFVNKDYVQERLSHHIRPLFYRQKYGISVHNPLTEDIQKTYPMAFEFTKRAALASGMGPLSDDEIAYLTIYLSSDLDQKILENGETSATRSLIVGAPNMSTATLVEDQIYQICGIRFEWECADAKDLRRWMMDGYALVVALTSLPQELMGSNVVEITPFLSERNKRQIYKVLKANQIISRYESVIDGILQIVGESIGEGASVALRSDRLRFELFRFLDERDHSFMESLPDYVDENCLALDRVLLASGATWQDGVLAGARALQSDADSSSLVSRMTNIMRGNRFLYYRMAPDVVVVRCPMQGEKDAHVGAKIVLSSNGVQFPDGLFARVVICVATVNRYSHWRMLYSIYRLFSEPANVAALEKECVDLGGVVQTST